MKRIIALSTVACATFAFGIALAEPVAESNDVKPREEMATHVITGQLLRTWRSAEKDGSWWSESYIAEVRVKSVERGDGIEAGELAYVRYYWRKWQGGGRTPDGWSTGMENRPRELRTYRIFLAKNAPDGSWAKNDDGGFNVICPDGFAQISP